MQSTSGRFYEMGSQLGSGTYGTVYSVTRDDGASFAFKKFEKSSCDLDIGALREISILSMLKNIPPEYCLMRMEDIVVMNDEEQTVGIIMKKYNTDLHDALTKKILEKKDCERIALKLLQALVFLHDNGIIHRDIKPENILLDDNLNPVLTDFTLSKVFTGVSTKGTHTGNIATATYRAPEVVAKKPYGFPADVWSLGVVFYELFTGKQLVVEKDKEALELIYKQVPKFERGKIGTMLRGLLCFDPKKRWSARHALESKVFGDIVIEPFKIWTPMNNCKIGNDVEDMCENFEVEKRVTRMAAQTYINVTECSVHSAVELACKFYETDPISSGTDDFAEEEIMILKNMNYNLFI
jgi:serine/threonine protein kinase